MSSDLHHCFSGEGDRTLEPAYPNGVDGQPRHLLALADGRVMCTCSIPVSECSVRKDGGQTWWLDDVVRVRGRLVSRDLGYPASAVVEAVRWWV